MTFKSIKSWSYPGGGERVETPRAPRHISHTNYNIITVGIAILHFFF